MKKLTKNDYIHTTANGVFEEVYEEIIKNKNITMFNFYVDDNIIRNVEIRINKIDYVLSPVGSYRYDFDKSEIYAFHIDRHDPVYKIGYINSFIDFLKEKNENYKKKIDENQISELEMYLLCEGVVGDESLFSLTVCNFNKVLSGLDKLRAMNIGYPGAYSAKALAEL